jgi:hypothetical protein
MRLMRSGCGLLDVVVTSRQQGFVSCPALASAWWLWLVKHSRWCDLHVQSSPSHWKLSHCYQVLRYKMNHSIQRTKPLKTLRPGLGIRIAVGLSFPFSSHLTRKHPNKRSHEKPLVEFLHEHSSGMSLAIKSDIRKIRLQLLIQSMIRASHF